MEINNKFGALGVFQVAAWRKIVAILMIMVVAAVPALAEELPEVDASLLVLANSAMPLAEDYEPEDLVKLHSRRDGVSELKGVYTVSSTSIQLRDEAAKALETMCAAAEKDQVILYVRQGYRSYKDETARYSRLSKRGMAEQKPGENDYQTGLAVTVVNEDWQSKTLTAEFADTKAGKWMAKHAAKYGFVLRYPEGKKELTGWDAEPWHLRYVGVEAATYMVKNDLCLEEFYALTEVSPNAETVVETVSDLTALENVEPMERVVAEPVPETIYTPGRLVELEDVGPDGDHEISFIQP